MKKHRHHRRQSLGCSLAHRGFDPQRKNWVLSYSTRNAHLLHENQSWFWHIFQMLFHILVDIMLSWNHTNPTIYFFVFSNHPHNIIISNKDPIFFQINPSLSRLFWKKPNRFNWHLSCENSLRWVEDLRRTAFLSGLGLYENIGHDLFQL